MACDFVNSVWDRKWQDMNLWTCKCIGSAGTQEFQELTFANFNWQLLDILKVTDKTWSWQRYSCHQQSASKFSPILEPWPRCWRRSRQKGKKGASQLLYSQTTARGQHLRHLHNISPRIRYISYLAGHKAMRYSTPIICWLIEYLLAQCSVTKITPS